MKTEIHRLQQRRLVRHQLIENKLTFSGPDSELSIYDTYRKVSRVGLKAPQLMYCGMVKGKKMMHSYGEDQAESFLPHESFIMPPGGYVEIDFPEASEVQPTTCLTIEIASERIEAVAERMRDITTLGPLDHDWQYLPQILHHHHTTETQQCLERLVSLYTQNHPEKAMMIDLGISELIIRLLREQGRQRLLEYCRYQADASGMLAVMHYIERNLGEPLNIEKLCRTACMSRSKLYREFKKQLGCGPGEYLHQRRIKIAAQYISQGQAITTVCFNLGYQDLAHFSRRFKAFFGCSPRQYRTRHAIQLKSQRIE